MGNLNLNFHELEWLLERDGRATCACGSTVAEARRDPADGSLYFALRVWASGHVRGSWSEFDAAEELTSFMAQTGPASRQHTGGCDGLLRSDRTRRLSKSRVIAMVDVDGSTRIGCLLCVPTEPWLWWKVPALDGWSSNTPFEGEKIICVDANDHWATDEQVAADLMWHVLDHSVLDERQEKIWLRRPRRNPTERALRRMALPI